MHSTSGREATLEPTGFEKDIIWGECRTAALQLAEGTAARCGIWECTPGSWRSEWASWEIFTVLSGAGTLTDESGAVHVLSPGEIVYIPEGSSGVWDVTETVRKSFVAAPKRA
jgi:uncharacterized protein